MKVPLQNLKDQHLGQVDDLVEAASNVVRSGWYLLGDEVARFEQSFSEYVGSKFCIGVANGLDALRITLVSWKEMGMLREHDEVLVPSNTFIASFLAITEARLTPVPVDPDPYTLNICLDQLPQILNIRTKVIMPVHLYGRICEMPGIQAFAEENGLLMLEDAAQAHGAAISGRAAGAWGDAGAFSFYPGKNLGALGDAGAITTNSESLNDVIRAVANYGSSEKHIHKVKGTNSRLDEIQAAFLNVKLRGLQQQNERRAEIASLYLAQVENEHIILPPTPREPAGHVWHQFVIRSQYRDTLQKFLLSCEIETQVHYPVATQNQKAFSGFRQSSMLTNQLQNEVLSLPIYPYLKDSQVDYVCECLNKFSP